MLTYHLTADEIENMKTEIAILPVGSVEQHGHHLPVATDWIIAEAYANRIAEKMKAFQTPTLPISTCREHMGKMGSVWMSPETFYQMITDICGSLQEQGFKKVVIVQGHGGIFILNPVVRQINALKNPELMVCVVQAYDFLDKYKELGIVESKEFLHADEIETSIIMYLAEDLVRKDRIVDHVPEITRAYLAYGSFFCTCPDGVWGYPSFATKEKGERLLEAGTDFMVKYANDVFSFMENKKPRGYSNF